MFFSVFYMIKYFNVVVLMLHVFPISDIWSKWVSEVKCSDVHRKREILN